MYYIGLNLSRIMNLPKHQLYLLEQHTEAFKIWSAIIRINTESKSLIMKLGPGQLVFTIVSGQQGKH